MKLYRYIIVAVLAVFFSVFLVLPLYTILERGLNVRILAEVFKNEVYLEGLVNSFYIAVVTTIMVFAISLPMALIYDRFDFSGKKLVNALVLLPMILPPFVGALGFEQIFGQYGVFNVFLSNLGICSLQTAPDWMAGGGRFWIVCLVEALHLYPILYLNTMTSLANVDPALDEAARNLGASPWVRFRKVLLPMIRPGLFAGGSIVFIWSFTELGTPLMLGYYRVTTVQIFNGITELESNPLPYALVVVLLVVAAGLYTLSRLLFGQTNETAPVKGMVSSQLKKLRGIQNIWPWLVFAIVLFLSVLPHLGVILLSVSKMWYKSLLPESLTMSHYKNALSHALVVPSILNSLQYSILATVFCVAIGLTVAILVVRWRLPGWQVFDVISMLPLAIPGIVMAFGYLSMATHVNWMYRMMNPIENPTVLLVIAYAIRRLPYVTRAAVAALQQTPVELENAARNLGAGPWMSLRKITIPLITANLIIGGLFAFSFSMLEVSDSLILAQKKAFYPITRAIFELSQILGSGPYMACAFGVWAMCFLATTLIVANVILGKKIGALFKF